MRTRIIAMLLVLCMVVVSFAACGGGDNADVTKAPTGNTDNTGNNDNTNKWEGVDFDGETIIISLSNYEPTVVKSAGATNSIKYIKGPDAYTTDSVQNAVFDRNKKVTDELDITVMYQECDQYSSNPDNTLVVIENFVLADLEDSPDIVETMSFGMVRAGIKGLLYNALTKDHKNYLDLTTNGWYSDYMYENTLDESKVFMLAGDYFIDVLRYSFGVLVNLDMYEDVFASEGGTASLFELIEAGDWTYDEMARCIQLAYVDSGTIGKIDDADTFGAVNDRWWLIRSAFANSGLDMYETTADGKLQYVQDISALHDFTDDMINFTSTEGFYLETFDGSVNYNHTSIFIEGKALFSFDAPVLVMEGTLLQNMDSKAGIIPFPKYNKEDDYGALVSDNGNVGGILYSSDKFTECSAFLQKMAEESNNGKGSLIYEYYDVALKYKLSNTPEQVAMLEFIRVGICSPMAILYDNYFARSLSMDMSTSHIENSIVAGTNIFASSWESQYDAFQGLLESTLATYGQQD